MAQPPQAERDNLKTACRQLANAAPDEWATFKLAFERYRQWLADGVAEADAAHIMIAKGSALGAKYLLQLFIECEGKKTP